MESIKWRTLWSIISLVVGLLAGACVPPPIPPQPAPVSPGTPGPTQMDQIGATWLDRPLDGTIIVDAQKSLPIIGHAAGGTVGTAKLTITQNGQAIAPVVLTRFTTEDRRLTRIDGDWEIPPIPHAITGGEIVYEIRLVVNESDESILVHVRRLLPTPTSTRTSTPTVTSSYPASATLTATATLTEPVLLPTVPKTLTPTLTATLPTLTPSPCTVSTGKANTVAIRVGPGKNRGLLDYMPANRPFLVTGQAQAGDGSAWWKLKIDDHTDGWVTQMDVKATGDCSNIGIAPPPPVSAITYHIVRFSIDNPIISQGTRTVMHWVVQASVSQTINGQSVTASSQIVVGVAEIYTLTVTCNDGKTLSSSVSLQVISKGGNNPPPPAPPSGGGGSNPPPIVTTVAPAAAPQPPPACVQYGGACTSSAQCCSGIPCNFGYCSLTAI